jgi:hypothetical protein
MVTAPGFCASVFACGEGGDALCAGSNCAPAISNINTEINKIEEHERCRRMAICLLRKTLTPIGCAEAAQKIAGAMREERGQESVAGQIEQ